MSAGSAKAGRLFKILIGDGAVSEAFTVIGGLKASSIKLGANLIDTTRMSSADWRELLTGYGERQVTISGQGIFTNDTYEQLLRTKFLNLTSWNYQLIDQDGNIWAGAFMIKDLEFKGSDKDAQTYSMTLENNGAVTFTQA